MNELVSRWRAVVAALEDSDDEVCLKALRRWIEEWDDRFWASNFTGFEEIYAEDFVAVNNVPIGLVHDVHGPAGFAVLREEMADVASRFWFDIHEFERGPDGRFAGIGRMRGRGRYSRVLVQSPWAVVWERRGDKLVSAAAYINTRRARRELGEPAVTP